MFNLSGSEIVIILLLALVVLGPDKLPEAMRKAGRTWAELRKMSSNFQDEVRKGFEEPSQELRQTASAVKKAATLTASPVKGAVKSLLEPPPTATVAGDAVAATPAEPVAPDDTVAATTASVADDTVAATPAEPLADGPAADESLVGEVAMAERAEVAVTESAAADVVAVDAVAEQGATTEPPIDEVATHNEEAAASEPLAVEDAEDVAVTDDAVAPAGPSS